MDDPTTTMVVVQPPDDLRNEIAQLVAKSLPAKITSDEELADVEAVWNEAKGAVKRIETFFEPHKSAAHKLHKGLCDAETAAKRAPVAVVTAADAIMKPYLRKREEDRQAEQRRLEAEARREAEEKRAREAEAARIEAEERAKQERAEAEERARIERENAERIAKEIEDEAQRKAEELAAKGDDAAAMAVIDEAAQRMTNIRDDAEETIQAVKTQAEEIAERTVAEGRMIAEEIAAAPVQAMHVAAPAGPTLSSASTSKTYKSNRQKADTPQKKLKGMQYAVAEAARGNFATLSWFKWDFAQVDASARQQREMFPDEETCGVDVGLDVGLRAKPGKAAS